MLTSSATTTLQSAYSNQISSKGVKRHYTFNQDKISSACKIQHAQKFTEMIIYQPQVKNQMLVIELNLIFLL